VKPDVASRQEVRIERLTPAYWRITFDIYPYLRDSLGLPLPDVFRATTAARVAVLTY
jgi:hypothetical protein